ncbi:hypothetical protein BC832DRAFT_527031, partial [Gaertneriomyces semiglobifer]
FYASSRHAKRYLAMYHPSAGFEVAQTQRYKTSGKVEACLIATRDFKSGDEIRHCTGVMANLSEQEEEYLLNCDFSVIYSSKRACNCLFLGPARFVNHDCKPNCQFIVGGNNVISFKVLRDIAAGDEITTYYSDNYFGKNNCECLCETCERYVDQIRRWCGSIAS